MENTTEEIIIRIIEKNRKVSIFVMRDETNIRYHDSMGGEFEVYVSPGSSANPYITMSKDVYEAFKNTIINDYTREINNPRIL